MENQSDRQGQEESRREAIVDAAARIFAEKGFSGTSNREIAREAGISPGLIYWYFRDKDDLFKAVIGRLFPLYGLNIPDEGADELGLYQLLEMIGQQFMGIMTHPDVMRLMRLAITELIRFPEVLQELGRMVGKQVIDRLAGQLDARIARGDLPEIDTRLAAQAYFGALIAYVLRKYMYRSVDLAETPDEEMVRTTAQIFAGGLSTGAAPGMEEGA